MPPLQGVIPPLVTPLDERGQLDESAGARLLDRVLGGGVDALFVLGTTGEGPSLAEPVRRRWIEQVCTVADGRAPVLVGITASCLDQATALADFAANAGAAATVLAPPFYYRIGQAELVDWCRAVADRCPLPVVLYHMPGNTAVGFELETLGRLIDDERFAGFKDSGDDLDYFRAVLDLAGRRRPGWPVIIGPENRCVEAMRAGASGWTSAVAQIDPARTVALRDALADGVAGPGTPPAQAVVELLDDLMACSAGDGRIVRTLKAALAMTGIGNGRTAPPLRPCDPAEQRAVRRVLESAGVPGLTDEPSAPPTRAESERGDRFPADSISSSS